MNEYYVRYLKSDGEDCLVVLPSFWKLLIWFIRTAEHCDHIVIYPAEIPFAEEPGN